MNIKIRLLKIIDRFAGLPLVFLLSIFNQKYFKSITSLAKILIIRPGGIGDAVLLFPAINALKSKFPESDIDMLCEKRNADIFGLSPSINKIYLYDRDLELFKCLKIKYDVVIDSEQWHRLSAIATFLTGASVRIGYDTNERSRLFTHKISYSHDDYEVHSFIHLIEPILGESPVFDNDKPFLDIADVLPDHLLPKSMIEKNRLIAVFPGASVKERRWGGERYGEVAKALNDQGFDVLILGAEADRNDAEKIKEYVPASLDLTGRTNLKEVAFLLKKCKLLIAADSGLLHLAYAIGTPTVSLFGSGIEKKWAPQGKRHVVLNKHLECSPCTKYGYTPECLRGIGCLKNIRSHEVIQYAKRLLIS